MAGKEELIRDITKAEALRVRALTEEQVRAAIAFAAAAARDDMPVPAITGPR